MKMANQIEKLTCIGTPTGKARAHLKRVVRRAERRTRKDINQPNPIRVYGGWSG